MTDATIFAAEDNGSTQPTKTEGGDQNLLNALVGETQKYKSAEELAKAYTNADAFIQQLKEENRQLREKAAQAKTIDEVLERISQQTPAPQDDVPVVSGIKPEDVQKLVEQTLVGREQQKTREQNLLAADKAMKEKFGDKAGELFKQRASTPEKAKILMELAATDPAEFVSLFAGVASTPVNNMDAGSVNTTSVAMSGGSRGKQEGTKEWAAQIRKENPNLYWSQDFQYKLQQMVTSNPSLYFGS